jgi:hypothetical protein
LRSMIGRNVEIIVLEDQPTTASSALVDVDPQAFWKNKTLDDLAAEQGVGPYSFDDPRRVVFTQEDFEGFDEQLEKWRNEREGT